MVRSLHEVKMCFSIFYKKIQVAALAINRNSRWWKNWTPWTDKIDHDLDHIGQIR